MVFESPSDLDPRDLHLASLVDVLNRHVCLCLGDHDQHVDPLRTSANDLDLYFRQGSSLAVPSNVRTVLWYSIERSTPNPWGTLGPRGPAEIITRQAPSLTVEATHEECVDLEALQIKADGWATTTLGPAGR